MAVLQIARGQHVNIPALQLTNGKVFEGSVRDTDGETLIIELDDAVPGHLPDQVDGMLTLNWNVEGRGHACPILVRSHEARRLVVQVVIQERRDSPRLRVEVQVRYALVPTSEVKQISEQVLAQVNSLSDPDERVEEIMRVGADPMEEIRDELRRINRRIDELGLKIDNLAGSLNGGEADAFAGRMPVNVENCSSSGIGFIADEGLAEGAYLRMRLTLQTVPRTVIDCMGVVVRSNAIAPGAGKPTRHDVGVRFTHMHESDRERLIHFLFRVQRRMLRDRTEQRTRKELQV